MLLTTFSSQTLTCHLSGLSVYMCQRGLMNMDIANPCCKQGLRSVGFTNIQLVLIKQLDYNNGFMSLA